MRRMIYIFCLLAASCCLAQSAATARLGALGRNDTVVTSVTFGGPAARLDDGTNIVTAAREVYLAPRMYPDVVSLVGGGTFAYAGEERGMHWWGTIDEENVSYNPEDDEWIYYNISEGAWGGKHEIVPGKQTVSLTNLFDSGSVVEIAFTVSTNLVYVGRLALTNELPKAGAEWAVGTTEGVICWTNGMIDVSLPHDDLQAVTNGWPDGASVFVRLRAAAQYIVHPPLRLVGYAAWPTNEAEAVAWRSGTNVFVNVIRIGE